MHSALIIWLFLSFFARLGNLEKECNALKWLCAEPRQFLQCEGEMQVLLVRKFRQRCNLGAMHEQNPESGMCMRNVAICVRVRGHMTKGKPRVSNTVSHVQFKARWKTNVL